MFLTNQFLKAGSLAIIIASALSGCGGKSGNGDVSVVDISSDSQVVAVGSGVVLAVDVTFDADRVTGGKTFHLVVRLPAALRFRANSAEIDGFTSVDDAGKTPIVSNCQSGEQFLAFDFSHSDLLRAGNPAGDGDMRLNLTVNGVSSSANATIEATADEELPDFVCGQPFSADKQEIIQVQ